MRIGVDEAVGAVCAAVVAVYAWPLFDPHREWQFLLIWDDFENFVDNQVYRGLSLEHLRGIFTLVIINVWEPFGWLLKALVFVTAGLDSRAYRIATLLFHLGAAWVLARTAALILALMQCVEYLTRKHQAPMSFASSETAPSAIDPSYHLRGCLLAALVVFVIHPINVEVVSWPSAQPYALAAFFSALSLFFHCRRLYRVVASELQARSPRAARGASPESESVPSDWDRLGTLVSPSVADRDTQLSAACFVAAVLSKSVCILLPVATVLVDCLVVLPQGIAIRSRTSYLPTPSHCARYGIRYVWGKTLLAIVIVAFVAVTLTANKEGASPHADILTLTVSERMIKAFSTPALMVRSFLWPMTLRPHYQLLEDEVTLMNPEYVLSIGTLLLLVGWLASHARVPSLLALAYFCAMMLPTCGLIQHGVVAKGADRYAYFPLMVLIPFGGHYFTRWLDLDASIDSPSEHVRLAESASTAEDRTSRSHKNGHRRVGSRGSRATPARLAFAVVLMLLLAIDRQQMQLWEDSEKFLERSLSLDRADPRLLLIAYEHKVKWGGGCGDDRQQCTNWLHLSYYYSPIRSHKAKMYRYMLLVLLDRRDLACEGYKLMKIEYPDSAMVENNLAVCAFVEDRFEAARDHIIRAQSLTFYSNYGRQSISENHGKMVPWIEARAPGHQQPGFSAKLVW